MNLNTDANKEPKMELQIKAHNLNMPKLGKIFIKGVGSVDLRIATILGNYMDMLNNATGQANLVISDGVLIGFDFEKVLNKSKRFLVNLLDTLRQDPNQDPNTLISNNQTTAKEILSNNSSSNFNALKVQAFFDKNTTLKSQITIKSPAHTVDGDGTIDLSKHSFSYRLLPKLVENPSNLLTEVPQYMQITPPIIYNNGNMETMNFNVDLQSYLSTTLKQLQSTLKKNNVNQQLHSDLVSE